MFDITTKELDLDLLKKSLENEAAGACVFFEGWVRNHNDGRSVDKLEYECYEALAKNEGAVIIEEAKKKFAIHEASCIHRYGSMEIGDLAIWCGVSSSHRKAAFEACDYIIDQVKLRVPVWKKEFYTGSSDHVWVRQEPGSTY